MIADNVIESPKRPIEIPKNGIIFEFDAYWIF